ncbi:MAG: hypothetical protein WA717_07025 [Methyloceanibacter sp.]|jgi:hypothetical protein
MLTRVLFAGVLICWLAGPVSAEEAKVVALGLADREVTVDDLAKGQPPVPKFNTPAIAYVLAADLKKGDVVEISLSNEEKPLLSNSETLTDDKQTFMLLAGKRGVPAGGWPQEWKYSAAVKITRDGKTLIEQSSPPIPFE